MARFAYVLNLLKFAFRANPLLYFAVVLAIGSAGIELLALSSLFPLITLVSGDTGKGAGIIGRLLDLVGAAHSASAFIWAFVVLFALRILTELVAQSLSIYLSKRVMAQLGSQAFDEIMHRVSVREINRKSIGFYIGLAGDEAFRASTLVISIVTFTSTAALATFYFLGIYMYSPLTAGLVIAFLGLSAIPYLVAMRASHRLGIRQTEESRRAHSVFLESLNNLKAVRAFSAEPYVVGLYRKVIFQYARTLFIGDAITLTVKLVPVLILLAMFAGWLLFATNPVQNIGLAFVVTMIVYLMRFFPVVGQGVMLSMRIAGDAKSGRDVTAIVTAEAPTAPTSQRTVGPIESLSLQNVRFAFDHDASHAVLAGIDLRFQKGRSYAIAGRSGVGKSTLVDLLLRFYAPDSGTFELNGIPFVEISDAELRKRIILVSQEPAIFDDTVANNIRMGVEAAPERIAAACRLACIDDLIAGMPNGYDTRLQYQGKNLSGGQRQRIAIARALLRDPDVLILDESTSALDKDTQAKLLDNVLRELAQRTVILITHDPAILARVDEVIDLEKINQARRRTPASAVGG